MPLNTIPKEIEVYVVSFGGVGTTFFLNFISHFFRTNNANDLDGLKHLPSPPEGITSKTKIIYMYGNPQHAVTSLFRRNIHHYQHKKLRTKTNEEIIDNNMTLQEYAALGVDKFKLRGHFYNWYNYRFDCPVAFVKYETIFENIDKIIDFVGLPGYLIRFFPKKKKRNSGTKDLPTNVKKQLDGMYGKLSEEFDRLAGVEIRNWEKQHSICTKKFLLLRIVRFILVHFIESRPKIFALAQSIKQLTKNAGGWFRRS